MRRDGPSPKQVVATMRCHGAPNPGPKEVYGYVSAAHNWINFDTMTQVLNSGVTAKGNIRNSTCNGAYKDSLNVGAETRGDNNIEKNLQKMIIPDGLIGRFLLDAPFNSPRHRIALTTVKPSLSQIQNFGVSCHNTECQSATGSS